MNILFIHPNFPAQFWHLSLALAQMGGNKVMFLTTKTNGNKIAGVTTVLYKRSRPTTTGLHPWLEPVE